MSSRKKTKRAKPPTTVVVSFDITSPHATTVVRVDCDKIATKSFPTVFRGLADAIESGELPKLLEEYLAVEGYTIKLPKRAHK